MFRKISLISILYTLYCLPLFGQIKTFNQGTIREPEYFSKIPFEFKAGKIIITVTIDNQDFRFILDTGAPTIITDKLRKKLALKALQKIEVGDQSSLKDSLSTCYIQSMKIGKVTFDSTISLIQNNQIFDCFNVDGIIGSNQLRNSIIHLSLQDSNLTITNKISKLPVRKEHSSQLNLGPFQSSPYILVQLLGKKKKKETVLFDSGYNGFYNLSSRHYKIFSKKAIFTELSESYGNSLVGLFGAENTSKTSLLFLKELLIGSTSIKNITLQTTQGDDSCIGTELLNYGTVTIDNIGKQFYFTPFDGQKSFNYEQPAYPFELGLNSQNKVIIGQIWNKESMGKVEVGDQVIEINKIPILDICPLLTGSIRYKDFKQVKMVVQKKNGERLSIEVSKVK